MGKLSNLFGQELSRTAAKAAADAVWEQKNGASAYNLSGKIFVGSGVGWILLSLIPIACKNPISDYIWMLILAAIQIILVTIFVVLSKKSKRFQEWADKDFKKDLERRKKLEERVTIGKTTLPITHGDVLAFKILGVIAVILIVILGIGTFQGWVVW